MLAVDDLSKSGGRLAALDDAVIAALDKVLPCCRHTNDGQHHRNRCFSLPSDLDVAGGDSRWAAKAAKTSVFSSDTSFLLDVVEPTECCGRFVCTDFRKPGSKDEYYDIDFWVNQKSGKLEGDNVKIHKVPVQEDGVWTQAPLYLRRHGFRRYKLKGHQCFGSTSLRQFLSYLGLHRDARQPDTTSRQPRATL